MPAYSSLEETAQQGGWTAGYIFGTEIHSIPSSTTLTHVRFNVTSLGSGSGSNIKIALYDESGGLPYAKKAETATYSITSTGLKVIPFTSSFTTTNTNRIHVCVHHSNDTTEFGYHSGGSGHRSQGTQTTMVFPSNISSIMSESSNPITLTLGTSEASLISTSSSGSSIDEGTPIIEHILYLNTRVPR